jgi:hypothetical protein
LNGLFCQDSDSRRIIPVSHTFTNFTNYHKSGIPHSPGDFTAFASSCRIGSQYGLEWQTIVSLLRADDEVVLDWIAGNNSGYLEAAQGQYGDEPYRQSFSGLHHDMLALVVRRGERDKYRFRLADSICPDNSARMIRLA